MIAEYKAFFEAFKVGKELVNSATWKNRQVATSLIISFVASAGIIAQAFGYHIPIDEQQLTEVVNGGFAAFGLVNTILIYTTSAKVGLKHEE